MIDGYAPATAANLALENNRLRAELQARLAQLRACRGRVVEAMGSALAELCERAALPVHLDISLDHRLAADVETAGYFLVSEALTNAGKHARATEVRISVRCQPSRLFVEVADDGVGGAALGSGSGLRGLVDRIESVGGRLLVFSAPGRGTTVRAELPRGAH